MDATLTQSQRGELEEPRSTNDLANLMQGLMCMSQSLGPIHPLGPVPIGSMILDTPPAPPYDRTIGFTTGKG